MRNPIEQLREDVEEAHRYQHSFSGNRIRMARVFDEFIAEHEVVEALLDDNGFVRRWRDDVHVDPPGCLGGEGTCHTTIIVSRKVPTLLEAAEGASKTWHASVISTPQLSNAMLKLDAAIERERGA